MGTLQVEVFRIIRVDQEIVSDDYFQVAFGDVFSFQGSQGDRFHDVGSQRQCFHQLLVFVDLEIEKAQFQPSASRITCKAPMALALDTP